MICCFLLLYIEFEGRKICIYVCVYERGRGGRRGRVNDMMLSTPSLKLMGWLVMGLAPSLPLPTPMNYRNVQDGLNFCRMHMVHYLVRRLKCNYIEGLVQV